MYEKFYRLSARPFQLNPDPRYFYRSKGHKRAQAYMRYGLQQEQGFIVVTGDVGTGKTMLVNNLFRELDSENLVAAKIVSSNLKDVDLLRMIAAEFDISFERKSKAALLNHLETYFKSCRRDGKRVLLVIDEAQNLPRSALEELRMLSNFEYEGTPLVQSFLLGQREFRSVLRAPGLEQLRQRVIAAYHLKPLTATEIKAYIEHRMRKAGWTNDPSIEQGVYDVIFEATGGVPRRINTLFDRVLLNGFLDEAHAITVESVRGVCEEVQQEQGDITGEDDVVVSDVSVSGTVEPAPGAGGVKVAELEERVQQMQRTIDDLNRKLLQQQALSAVVRPAPPPRALGEPQYPLWTIVFSLLIGLVVLGSAVGYWLFKA